MQKIRESITSGQTYNTRNVKGNSSNRRQIDNSLKIYQWSKQLKHMWKYNAYNTKTKRRKKGPYYSKYSYTLCKV